MRNSELKSAQTLDAVDQIKKKGIHNMTILMRHSEKRLTRIPGMEPFMPLTDPGKAYAVDFGEKLPRDGVPLLFSSTFGRCIETAYLIDKGFSRISGTRTPYPAITRGLTPFYVNNIRQVSELAQEIGNNRFISQWFARQFDHDMILDPETTADTLVYFMKQRLDLLKDKEIAVCISHDWNLFPVKEFCLGIRFDSEPDVGYLEGIILYRDGDRYYLAGGTAPPAVIDFTAVRPTRVQEL